MEKRKRWQFVLILAVIGLTIYNILPTVFFYTQPLKTAIQPPQAREITADIITRVNQLQPDAKTWLESFCDLLSVKPLSITPRGHNWALLFAKTEEAAQFRSHLPRAGALIPFAGNQLGLAPHDDSTKEVVVQRRVPLLLEASNFVFAPKGSVQYRDVAIDRAAQIAYALAGPTEAALALAHLNDQYLETLASQIISISEIAQFNQPAAHRYAAGFTQGPFSDRAQAIDTLVAAFTAARDKLKGKEGVETQTTLFIKAEKYLKSHRSLFAAGQDPLSLAQIKTALETQGSIDINHLNPLFSQITIDWDHEQILVARHTDFNIERFQQPLINEIAKVTRYANETLTAVDNSYSVALHTLPNASGFLALDLDAIGQKRTDEICAFVRHHWHPTHPDLQSLLIVDAKEFATLSDEQKALSLTFYPPSENQHTVVAIAQGFDTIIRSYEALPESQPALLFQNDLKALAILFQECGFRGFPSGNAFVFEQADLSHALLTATREDFVLRGTHRYALLELSDLEHRLLAQNRIDTQIHEDLIKWRDEYNSAQVSIQPGARFDVPKPTQSVFWHNILLSWKKFIKGDERKVIRWGLDLSGGKTIQVELRDANHQIVSHDEDIRQGMNELYNRVNKMGVSEVAIRQLGNHIVLDFPSSQSIAAADLIKASSMYFHVVNEKFSLAHPALAETVNRFLQEVWNEAVVTDRKNAQDAHAIAWAHLYSETPSESARTLKELGLQLQAPDAPAVDHTVNDTLSKIAMMRGSDSSQWNQQTHPLLIVFSHYTLEGSRLENIHASYDPQKGNYLSFEVQKGAPRAALEAWTSRYSKERVLGTALEDYAKGRGWRMAVILNDTVISAPTLDGVIRDSASISGSFSQREINQLAADLKAGSLTFTPHILSEKNVSPELGKQDRTQGIFSTIVALLLVVGSMIAYYRFAGVVASIAVLFNLLILWATLQNIGATLSLAGIAGIILTVGMAVDANVLVFERIKEEFAKTGRIAPAIAAGYQKAYTAIVDSNVTTVIAALILLNFDAGPIKGFAITLIIGIVSSMFTALFMTRFYFAGWVQHSKNQALVMADWIRAKSINFLKQAKLAFAIAISIIVVGGSLLYAHRYTILGMDFTGGFSLHVEFEPRNDGQYIPMLEQALIAHGASATDFQIRTLTPSNHIRLLLSTAMEQSAKPFHAMPLQTDMGTNPRIDWVVQAIASSGLHLTSTCASQMSANWTAMSGQMSDSMRNNALLGLLLAFICIFIYIAIRFEYKFAAAAIICLLHDVLITLGLMGLLHALGVPIQIDLNTVAAMMTIVGYSLNDTIIIFDRIREMSLQHRNRPLYGIVNDALNTTLSRTTITSGTTLLVLIALVALGGPSIFSFALVMTIGVFFGTLSSWYIASPIMLFFHHKETMGTQRVSTQ